jgi:hypothetical protein
MKRQSISDWYRQKTARFRCLPDFIIIGAQKGGTSSLLYYLSQHPQLSIHDINEIHFFDIQYLRGINWYRSLFPLKIMNKKTGEASPYYLFHPHVAQRVYTHCPKVKLIVMLRNPVYRAYSNYMMQKQNGRFDPLHTFEEAIEIEEDKLSEEANKLLNNPLYHSIIHQRFSYLARGMYYTQLTKWLKYFPLNQFLFIKSEDFFNDPFQELLRVYQFLGIKIQKSVNLTPQNTNNYLPMNEKTRSCLYTYFAEENKKLSEILGSDFLWEE